MSKSKGNVIDPLDLIDGIELDALLEKRTGNMMQPQLAKKIEKQTLKHFPDGIASYGTDALRFTLCSLASTGRDIKLDLGRIEGNRNFCNKIWNATNYVLMNCEAGDCGQTGSEVELSLADRWIRSRLQKAEQKVTESMGCPHRDARRPLPYANFGPVSYVQIAYLSFAYPPHIINSRIYDVGINCHKYVKYVDSRIRVLWVMRMGVQFYMKYNSNIFS